MATPKAKSRKRTRSPNLCQAFQHEELRSHARPGLGVLEHRHKAIIRSSANRAKCGVHLDLCFQDIDDDEKRWDYVFDCSGEGVGIEVHPPLYEDVQRVIGKKKWAASLLARVCPDLHISEWVWVSPPGNPLGFPPGSTPARQLAEHGIVGPRRDFDV